MDRPTDEQVEQGFRLLRRLELYARHDFAMANLTRETCRLLASLPPGTIEDLDEARAGDRPSDAGVA
jgi:hypothetical protein